MDNRIYDPQTGDRKEASVLDLIEQINDISRTTLFRFYYDYHFKIVRLDEFKVVRETKCFYFIDMNYYGNHIEHVEEKRVSKEGVKRFAYLDIDEAWTSFRCRSFRYVDHCERRLKHAREALHLARAMDPREVKVNY